MSGARSGQPSVTCRHAFDPYERGERFCRLCGASENETSQGAIRRRAPSLGRELEDLERTDPAVGEAARKYDAMRARILATSATCILCRGGDERIAVKQALIALRKRQREGREDLGGVHLCPAHRAEFAAFMKRGKR